MIDPRFARQIITSGDAMSQLPRKGKLGTPDPGLESRFSYSEGTARPDTDDEAARAGVLSRGSVIGTMLEDPGADRRAAEGLTPTSRESQQEAEYLQAQVDPAVLADQRRQEAIALEAAQIEMQQKLSAGEAARRFEETYGVPYDKDSAKFIMDAERSQQIEDDYNQAVSVLQGYLATGIDGFGKPYSPSRYTEDLKKLAITRGLKAKAPAGYFQAVAPPDPYGIGAQQNNIVEPALPPTS